MVLDTFVIERSHLKVKAVADGVDNTNRYERSVLAGVLNVTFKNETASSTWCHALLGHPNDLGGNTFSSKKMRIYGLAVEARDIVF